MNIENSTRIVLITAMLMQAAEVLGADTVETWDVGATDVDMYFGVDGIGHDKGERTLFGDMMLGYGIIDGFSVYLGTTLQGDESMMAGSGNIYLGMFGTPVDTEHFDMDLFFDVSLGGDAFKHFQIGPAIELNFDLSAERRSWGLYLRAEIPVYGRAVSNPAHPDSEDTEMTTHLESTIGTYWTVSKGQQLLCEFSMGVHPDPAQDEREFDIGGVAFGYNVSICDSIELINQVYLDIPQEDETISVGIMLGFIATLPSSSSSHSLPK